jgi:hypothetical protein
VTRGTVLLDTNVFTEWLKPRSTLVPLYGTRFTRSSIWVICGLPRRPSAGSCHWLPTTPYTSAVPASELSV